MASMTCRNSSPSSDDEANNTDSLNNTDETDSCLQLRRQQQQQSPSTESTMMMMEPEVEKNLEEKNKIEEEEKKKTPEITIVNKTKMINVKPVVRSVTSSSAESPKSTTTTSGGSLTPSKLRIDKIAENLKLNLQQKEARLKENTPLPPRVVTATPLANNRKLLNIKPTAIVKPTSNRDIDDDDELERNDSLTDLGWLTNFNFKASVGLPANYPLSLSPPISPPLAAAAAAATAPKVAVITRTSQPYTHSARRAANVKPCNFSISYGGDEADGRGSLQSSIAHLNDISSCLKPVYGDIFFVVDCYISNN